MHSATILWLAGPHVGDQLTLTSDEISRQLLSGQQFSDWDELVFVMQVTAEDDLTALPTTLPLHTHVEGFKKAASSGRVWIQSGPVVKHDDSHRPWLEPEFGPSMLATRISYESDTEFKFRNAPKGYGLLRIIGINGSTEAQDAHQSSH